LHNISFTQVLEINQTGIYMMLRAVQIHNKLKSTLQKTHLLKRRHIHEAC